MKIPSHKSEIRKTDSVGSSAAGLLMFMQHLTAMQTAGEIVLKINDGHASPHDYAFQAAFFANPDEVVIPPSVALSVLQVISQWKFHARELVRQCRSVERTVRAVMRRNVREQQSRRGRNQDFLCGESSSRPVQVAGKVNGAPVAVFANPRQPKSVSVS